MTAVTFIKNTIAHLVASIYTRIVSYTDALNQAREQSGRFSGAYW